MKTEIDIADLVEKKITVKWPKKAKYQKTLFPEGRDYEIAGVADNHKGETCLVLAVRDALVPLRLLPLRAIKKFMVESKINIENGDE